MQQNSRLFLLPKSARCLGSVAETPTPAECEGIFDNIMYTLNLCSTSLRQKQRDMMPVLSMTHNLALERKSASYDLAKRERWEAERGETQRGERRKRLITEWVEMSVCSGLCVFYMWKPPFVLIFTLLSDAFSDLHLANTSSASSLSLSLCFCPSLYCKFTVST